MGVVALLSSWIDAATSPRRKRLKQFQTVDLRVRMDCEGCERKVRNALTSMKGVRTVEVERQQCKVTVTGYVDANKVLKRVRRTGKRAEVWPYKPYHLVYYPYTAQVYDKEAPSGYVRNVDHTFPSYPSADNNTHETYTSLFSDDNTSGCTIM
eukprot:PITA_17819